MIRNRDEQKPVGQNPRRPQPTGAKKSFRRQRPRRARAKPGGSSCSSVETAAVNAKITGRTTGNEKRRERSSGQLIERQLPHHRFERKENIGVRVHKLMQFGSVFLVCTSERAAVIPRALAPLAGPLKNSKRRVIPVFKRKASIIAQLRRCTVGSVRVMQD